MNNSQEVAILIKALAKSKEIAIGKMLSDCALSVNTLSSMQSGGYYPRLEAIAKIADYLDCSVDYLLGRTDNPEINKDTASAQNIGTSEHEKRLIAAYRNKPEMQASVDKLLDIEGSVIEDDIVSTVSQGEATFKKETINTK